MEPTRILIVEDDYISAMFTETSLVEMGYVVTGTVGSGEEAIGVVRDDAPDLVLMDIILTGKMDGIEAASEIQKISTVPVIYVTGCVDDSFLSRAKSTVPFGYIRKPCERETLRTSIEIALYRHRMEEEKAQLESQNRQLQTAESLGRMAGAIVHHFNNQLGAVIGNLEMAIDDLPEGTKLLPFLTAAMGAAGTAALVSGQMQTYLGQSFDERALKDLSEVCRRMLPVIQAAMRKQITLETDLHSPGPVVRVNEHQIQQLLTNLVNNAEDAVGEGGGAIYLSVHTVPSSDISALCRSPLNWQPLDRTYACLEVKDTGCGIARKDIEHLFDPFFTRKGTGRGLGLSVVLGIVKAYGGGVTVESNPGRGSTFRLFFPLSGVELAPQINQTAVLTPEQSGSGTVLLVEDEWLVRDMAAAMLQRLGFSVIEAKDGVEAVELFRQRRDEIRLVISDLTMPRMDGWETLTALRQLVPDIPVILASGYDKAQVMAGDHPESPQVFLGKPYRLKELSSAIGRALLKGK